MKRYIIPALITLAILSLTLFKDFTINPFQEKILINKTIKKIETISVNTYRSAGINHKMLFPYDFIIGEPVWGLIIAKSSNFLTEDDIKNRDFYYKCKNIGINLNKNRSFFIIETKASAGFVFDDYIEENVISYDFANNKIVIKAPTTKLLSLEVSDSLIDKNFPDLDITPRQWKELIDLLLPIIEEDILSRGIIERSSEKNREFLESIYKTIGWNNIEFK